MSTSSTDLSRHYAGLAPDERLSAVLSATARKDYLEAGRLGRACPRRDYTAPDRDFADRVTLVAEAAAAAAIELQGLCGQLKALRWAAAVADGLAPLHRLDAELAFMSGVRSGLVAAWAVDAPTSEAAAIGGPAESGHDPIWSDDGWAGPLAKAVDRAGRLADRHRVLLDEAARDVATELAAAWAGLRRFCRDGSGVGAESVLAARGMGTLAGQVTSLLRQYPDVRPDPRRAAEYATLIGTLWVERLGWAGDDEEEHP